MAYGKQKYSRGKGGVDMDKEAKKQALRNLIQKSRSEPMGSAAPSLTVVIGTPKGDDDDDEKKKKSGKY